MNYHIVLWTPWLPSDRRLTRPLWRQDMSDIFLACGGWYTGSNRAEHRKKERERESFNNERMKLVMERARASVLLSSLRHGLCVPSKIIPKKWDAESTTHVSLPAYKNVFCPLSPPLLLYSRSPFHRRLVPGLCIVQLVWATERVSMWEKEIEEREREALMYSGQARPTAAIKGPAWLTVITGKLFW